MELKDLVEYPMDLQDSLDTMVKEEEHLAAEVLVGSLEEDLEDILARAEDLEAFPEEHMADSLTNEDSAQWATAVWTLSRNCSI